MNITEFKKKKEMMNRRIRAKSSAVRLMASSQILTLILEASIKQHEPKHNDEEIRFGRDLGLRGAEHPT